MAVSTREGEVTKYWHHTGETLSRRGGRSAIRFPLSAIPLNCRLRIQRNDLWGAHAPRMLVSAVLSKGSYRKIDIRLLEDMRRHRRAGQRGRDRGRRSNQVVGKGAEVYAKHRFPWKRQKFRRAPVNHPRL